MAPLSFHWDPLVFKLNKCSLDGSSTCIGCINRGDPRRHHSSSTRISTTPAGHSAQVRSTSSTTARTSNPSHNHQSRTGTRPPIEYQPSSTPSSPPIAPRNYTSSTRPPTTPTAPPVSISHNASPSPPTTQPHFHSPSTPNSSPQINIPSLAACSRMHVLCHACRKWWHQDPYGLRCPFPSCGSESVELVRLAPMFRARNITQSAHPESIPLYLECVPPELECSICISAIKRSQDTRLKCGHSFHGNCIGGWFKTLKDQRKMESCPVCRATSS